MTNFILQFNGPLHNAIVYEAIDRLHTVHTLDWTGCSLEYTEDTSPVPKTN